MKIQKRKAFTLLEILVTVALFTFLVAAVYQAFLVGNRSWTSYNYRVSMQRELRWTLYALVKDLREAKEILVTQDDTKSVLSFNKPGSGIIIYTWFKAGDRAQHLLRQEESKERTIAQHVSNLEFIQPSTKEIFVDITVTERPLFAAPLSLNLKQKVKVRI